MQNITITTPALLFPAISLIMLAYTNRFLALAVVVRSLKDKYQHQEAGPTVLAQLDNLRHRLKLIRQMQLLGIMSFILAMICMYLIYIDALMAAEITFALALLLFIISLLISLVEIFKSTRALELEMSEIVRVEK
jgi:Protein of unknown function (DUF2721)